MFSCVHRCNALISRFNPYDNVADENHHLVIGGQCSLWAEQTDESNFEMVLWPRAAAVAEIFWTGPEANGVRSEYGFHRTM